MAGAGGNGNPLFSTISLNPHFDGLQAAPILMPPPQDQLIKQDTDRISASYSHQIAEDVLARGLQDVDLQPFDPRDCQYPQQHPQVQPPLPLGGLDTTTTTPTASSSNTAASLLPPSFENMAGQYHPVLHHWFFRGGGGRGCGRGSGMGSSGSSSSSGGGSGSSSGGQIWLPFSFTDSFTLEEAYQKGTREPVPVEGGRYDVFIHTRTRTPVYWEEEEGTVVNDTKIERKSEKGMDTVTLEGPGANLEHGDDSGGTGGDVGRVGSGGHGEGERGEAVVNGNVRRCSWFHKGAMDASPVPYTELEAAVLEEAYRGCLVSGKWHCAVEQEDGSRVVLHSPRALVHYTGLDAEFPTGVSVNGTQAPLTVRRGTEDFEIEDGEAERVDHLLLVVHGIGSVCDLKLRPVHQCVDDFRKLGRTLLSTHFREAVEAGEAGRVEILPISWHKALHGEATGIDEKLRPITLRSIPKLREFTNDTILDALLFTSPVYCQHIIDTVASEMERLYALYKRRNPTFDGRVSVAGHSLGSVILFDILMNQEDAKDAGDTHKDGRQDGNTDGQNLAQCKGSKVEYVIGGGAGTGQPSLRYPQLSFHPIAFFLLGSPISMFITVRGIEDVGLDFRLPTCPRVLNIFHPFDPVAYRLEALVHPALAATRPVLVPHHKGRKRMHLELKETLERVGTDLRQKIVESIQGTWNKLYQYYSGPGTTSEVVDEDKIAEQFLIPSGREEGEKDRGTGGENEGGGVEKFGQLNGGRRIDYVLQEKPYESFNEYIFALQAHLTYWESEDTMLLILKELYGTHNVLPDCQRTHVHTNTHTSTHSLPSPSITSVMPPQSVTSIPLLPTSSLPSSSFSPPPPVPLLPPLPPSPVHPSSSLTPSSIVSSSLVPPSLTPTPAPPPPSFSPSLASSSAPPPSSSLPPSLTPTATHSSPHVPLPHPPAHTQMHTPGTRRVIGGRPVMGWSSQQLMGMDPTVRPAGQNTVRPPPKMATGTLTRMSNLRR